MASITKRAISGTWQAQVRRRGYETLSRTFDAKKDAQDWARQVEHEMDRGIFFDRTEAERTTLADALERYRREVVPEKRHPYQENQRINRWLDYPITKRSLANLLGADFAAYRDARRAAGRAENTIRLELALQAEPAVYHDDFADEVAAQLRQVAVVLVWHKPIEADAAATGSMRCCATWRARVCS